MTATSQAQQRGARVTAMPGRTNGSPPEPGAMTHREVLESLSGLLLVLFVSLISGTIVSTALPRIIGELNGSQTQYTWVVTATLLTATVTTPIWGRLADLFSKKLLLQISISIFVVGSIISGFAQDTPQLIGSRAIQGIGVGGLQALVQVVIAAMIPPRERGRYNGYLGAVMAAATVGGPLLGGVIVDSWLGWRWCFFIGVPFGIAAFALLQRTLHLPTVRQQNVKIDYLGASLIAVGVSTLLIWITFVDHSFDWLSWQTAALVLPALLILVGATWVESRAAQPIVPLKVIRQKVPALAIVASLAVGMAMFGGAVFLGQYFQIGRGYSPTKAGLVTIPLMAGVLVASTISGRLITKTGKIKPWLIAGATTLVAGFVVFSFMDHQTPLWILWIGMVLVGAGVGMTMQNLVLSVQNAVDLRDLGASSGAVTFFRSLGGTIGVAVLGAVLANRVANTIAENLAKAGIPLTGGGGGSSLDLANLPEPIREIVRASYGDATGHIFLISAAIGVVGIIAALFMPRVVLRTSIDLPAKDPVGIDGLPETEEVIEAIDETNRRPNPAGGRRR
jgi:EmrB/QacA subfamily drug resistance transporter